MKPTTYIDWGGLKDIPFFYCDIILIGYLLVMVLDFRRIKRIPMDQALKNVE